MLFSPPRTLLPLAASRRHRTALASARLLCWKSLVCLVGFSDPAAAVQRKEQNPSGLAAVPLLSCLSQPVRARFLLRYELFSILFTLHLPKRLEPDDFSAEDIISLERSGSL